MPMGGTSPLPTESTRLGWRAATTRAPGETEAKISGFSKLAPSFEAGGVAT